MTNSKGPIDKIGIPSQLPASRPNGRLPSDPANYVLTPSGLIASKYFARDAQHPLDRRIFVPPLVEAYSLDDIQIGTLAVAREGEAFYCGLKHNLYFPEYKLYVINTDNLTFFVLAEAAKRGDIDLGASIFTCDAHTDILPLRRESTLMRGHSYEFSPKPWTSATLADYAEFANELSPLQQLQAAVKLGLIKEREIHLILPAEGSSPADGTPLCLPGSFESLGMQYHYPALPFSHFNSLPTKKIVAHVDIDFHSEEFGGDLQKILSSPGTMSMDALLTALSADVERVSPSNVEGFKRWVKETGFFKKAGLRIICVSPQIVHPEDVVWLTQEHVKMVMEEASVAGS